MSRFLMLAMVLAVSVFAPTLHAQVRLIGITGNQQANEAADETIFDINLTTAATTKIMQLTHIPDSDAIGYNPSDGLLYHFSGASSYRNDPTRIGYRDDHYMETVNLETGALNAIFNANPPPSPDTAFAFGLAAPRPTWLLPESIRLDTDTDGSFSVKGVNEYGSARGAAWSEDENVFYLSADEGFFRMTPEGESTFVARAATEPGAMKGIAFVQVNGETKLLAGSKDTGIIYEFDPATGEEIGAGVQVQAPPFMGGLSEPTGRVLGLTQHPETGVLYGILEPVGEDPFNRQLATIDLVTGMATVIGALATPENDAPFASIAFVGFGGESFTADFDNDGDVDAADLTQWRDDFGANGDSDADGDGDSDGNDFLAWQNQLGSGIGGGTAAVPEPTCLGMGLLASVGALAVRKRRR